MAKNLYAVIVVGVGGTGSFVACDLARYLASSAENIRRTVSIVLADGDRVEDKNRARQMYYPEDVGLNKADCLAQSINDTFDLDVLSSGRYIDTVEDIATLFLAATFQLKGRVGNSSCDIIPVIVSCVDNVPARKLMEEYFHLHSSVIYIDSGNGFSKGQCIYAVKDEGTILSPARDFYGFEFLEEENQKARSETSCEELNNVAPQHILANRYASFNILSAIFQLLEGQGIKRGFTTFDAFNCTSTHVLPEGFGFEVTKEKKRKTKEKKRKKKKED